MMKKRAKRVGDEKGGGEKRSKCPCYKINFILKRVFYSS